MRTDKASILKNKLIRVGCLSFAVIGSVANYAMGDRLFTPDSVPKFLARLGLAILPVIVFVLYIIWSTRLGRPPPNDENPQ